MLLRIQYVTDLKKFDLLRQLEVKLTGIKP